MKKGSFLAALETKQDGKHVALSHAGKGFDGFFDKLKKLKEGAAAQHIAKQH